VISRWWLAPSISEHRRMTELVRPLGVLRTRVEIRTYPRDDEAFVALVLEQLRRFDRVRHAAAIPGRLEILLQAYYPRAKSRYQDPLASSTGMPLLYVFRDGSLLTEDEEAAARIAASQESAIAVGAAAEADGPRVAEGAGSAA
jgi:hypothetical protein